jgi:cystathionine gamma-synthase
MPLFPEFSNQTEKKHEAATLAARAAVDTDSNYGAVMPPLYLSSNFTFNGFKGKRQYDYTRSGNPTRDAVGKAIAELESGYGSVMTASGMSALDLLFHHVKPGEVIFAPHDCYGGTYRLLRHKSDRGFYQVRFLDQTDLPAFERALEETPPALILVETPSNPLLRLSDIETICRLGKAKGALCAVDNTFLSPVLQNPLALGADVVIHSTTKYLNGHSDVVGGALVSKTEELHQQFTWWGNCIGNTGAPFDSYLTLRGLRTLEIRIRHQEESARQVAEVLAAHPAVTKVYYPGLKNHPGHALACRQQKGFGAMLSFELAGGEPEIITFINSLKLFSLAESLGGVESLIAHPATMTHGAMDPEARRTAGLSDQLLRLSIGLESIGDLLDDLQHALHAAQHSTNENKALSNGRATAGTFSK